MRLSAENSSPAYWGALQLGNAVSKSAAPQTPIPPMYLKPMLFIFVKNTLNFSSSTNLSRTIFTLLQSFPFFLHNGRRAAQWQEQDNAPIQALSMRRVALEFSIFCAHVHYPFLEFVGLCFCHVDMSGQARSNEA